MNDYILIEYSNSVDFGDILYHNAFENRIYLDADVSKPQYDLVEEGIENGDGVFNPTFQKWAKSYSIVFYAQEFLVDALTLMTMHDQVIVTLKNGESSKVLDINVTPKWDSDIECWAEVTVDFTTDYIIRTKCDENVGSCFEAVVIADDVYDANDGGAGQTRWENDELPDGTVSFFHSSLGATNYYTGDPLGFYMSMGGVWTLISMENGQFGEITAFADEQDWLIKVSDEAYSATPHLVSVTDQTGGIAKVYARSTLIESTFFQVQYYTGGTWHDIGDPAKASTFETYGVLINIGASTYYYRLKWYTHSCTYGYSNQISETVT